MKPNCLGECCMRWFIIFFDQGFDQFSHHGGKANGAIVLSDILGTFFVDSAEESTRPFIKEFAFLHRSVEECGDWEQILPIPLDGFRMDFVLSTAFIYIHFVYLLHDHCGCNNDFSSIGDWRREYMSGAALSDSCVYTLENSRWSILAFLYINFIGFLIVGPSSRGATPSLGFSLSQTCAQNGLD